MVSSNLAEKFGLWKQHFKTIMKNWKVSIVWYQTDLVEELACKKVYNRSVGSMSVEWFKNLWKKYWTKSVKTFSPFFSEDDDLPYSKIKKDSKL